MKMMRWQWISPSWTVCVLVLCIWREVTCVENTQDICNRDPPATAASKTPGDNGFRIKIVGRPQPERYTPGQVYTVSINGTYSNQKLLGFMMVAVTLNAKDETNSMGTFQHMSHGVTKFAEECFHVVTHTFHHPKAGVEVLWTAPPAGTGCIEFRATVIEHTDIWYKNDGALTRVFCEDSGTTENHQPADMLPECCACGTAKYQITFTGTWSHRTHPKDYPTLKRLLHWSNIVGASHSKHYMIWQYGAYASKGVKEVCEFGYPRTLEEEMRMHSQDVRTVIKTPGIWYSEPHGLEQTRWARFSVDRKNHLLSMLTMIGPSPDWCVGVTGLNLCLSNCSWAGDMEMDLYPWDGGTDDGTSYMSRNMKSDPAQKIHRITNTYPNNPTSPFFGSDPIPALARLKLRRIHPKTGEPQSCSGHDDPTSVEEVHTINDDSLSPEELKKKMMMLSLGGKCAMSPWGDWSGCSVTCGVGQKFHKRMYLNAEVDEDMCGQPTMESENCIGIENECESVDDDCAATSWSGWSPCSVTCGKGIRERRRYYFNPMDMKRCDRSMEEMEPCMADLLDCQQALALKNFTAICSLPHDVGPCTGRFPRFYFDVIMRKCLPFQFGGCRGNNNRFRSQQECMDMCFQMVKEDPETWTGQSEGKVMDKFNPTTQITTMGTGSEQKPTKKPTKHHKNKGNKHRDRGQRNTKAQADTSNVPDSNRIDCMVTPWVEWSSCAATCGRSYKFKRRMVKRQPENGGKKCPKKLEKKRRCKLPKCSRTNTRDCRLGPWGEWTRCQQTCGISGIQERTRLVVTRARPGGQPCGRRLERRYCNLPPCSDSDEETLSKEHRMKMLRTSNHQGGL